jgi:hypothetical protein
VSSHIPPLLLCREQRPPLLGSNHVPHDISRHTARRQLVFHAALFLVAGQHIFLFFFFSLCVVSATREPWSEEESSDALLASGVVAAAAGFATRDAGCVFTVQPSVEGEGDDEEGEGAGYP